MRRKTVSVLFALVTIALGTRPWSEAEFERYYTTYRPEWLPRPESLVHGPRRFNYLERVKLDCDFVARYQVSDSMSADFGGIIEAEHMPTVIETDNTQEAIWIWSRWYELTGRDDFRTQIRRAWTYVLRHPAFREHGGNPSFIWYSVWNCGLGFMAEAEYRRVYGDSTFRAYADTCRTFFLANPLRNLAAQDYFVTSQSSGMAYGYAVEVNDPVLRDTALARGQRVRTWIESNARANLGAQAWAMCGGTAFWGVAHTVCREDTAAGRAWLQTYADSLPGFYPSGSWNCSHNIWLANAYRSAADLTGAEPDWLMHHYLVDTLLMRDTDRDGGIPATWTDPPTQDQTWVSTYLDFMGMDVFAAPTYNEDVSVLELTSPDPRSIYVAGDTVQVSVPLANVGRNTARDVNLTVEAGGMGIGVRIDSLPFLAIETLIAGSIPLDTPGTYTLVAYADGDDNPLNDTARLVLRARRSTTIDGYLTDTLTGAPVHAWLRCRIATPDSTIVTISGTVTWPGHSLSNYCVAFLDTSHSTYIAPLFITQVNPTSGAFSIRGHINQPIETYVEAFDDVNNNGNIDPGEGLGWWDRNRNNQWDDMFWLHPGEVLSNAQVVLQTIQGSPDRTFAVANPFFAWDSCETDSLGHFTLHIIDTLVAIDMRADVPYHDRSWSLWLSGDTTVNLKTQPAHVAVVSTDSLSRYAEYYTQALDSLGITWCRWDARTQGSPPYPQLDRLRARTLVWYSGTTGSGTVPRAEQDSLTTFLARGGNLFLTGQNIAEELQGTTFLEQTVGCRFDSSGYSAFFAFGDRADSLGAFITGTATASGNGANNQTSRDIVVPTSGASFIVYDSTVPYCAGVRQEATGGKVVFLGFGFEAVNRPSARPTYFTRPQLMGLILSWFGLPSGVLEQPQAASPKPQALPTIVRGTLLLPSSLLPPHSSLLSADGRRVLRLRPGSNDLSRLPAGVYFIRYGLSAVSCEPSAVSRVVIAR